MSKTPKTPYAITMWDFSWLERRWPGAGYEDWDQALDELAERGYNAVRIDAYPHLVSADPGKLWELPPIWNQTSWGAQSLVRVHVMPALIEFIGKCRDRGIGVGLSSWYRPDADNVRLTIADPSQQARIWTDTLKHVVDAGLSDAILYVDFCNEFPGAFWAPYLYGTDKAPEMSRKLPHIVAWMRESIEIARRQYPHFDYTYSFCSQYRDWDEQDVAMLDLLELHVWMALPWTSDWNQKVGYGFEKFAPTGFDNVALRGYEVYRDDKAKYDAALLSEIANLAAWSRFSGKPIVTTECWGVVDYKDWPLLDWGWVKDLCEMGVIHAAGTERWIGMATSNFCGPQFVGMWRDVPWHQRLTKLIKTANIAPDLRAAG